MRNIIILEKEVYRSQVITLGKRSEKYSSRSWWVLNVSNYRGRNKEKFYRIKIVGKGIVIGSILVSTWLKVE